MKPHYRVIFLLNIFDECAVGPFDAHAEPRGPRIAARSAVDVRDHTACVALSEAWAGTPSGGAK